MDDKVTKPEGIEVYLPKLLKRLEWMDLKQEPNEIRKELRADRRDVRLSLAVSLFVLLFILSFGLVFAK